MDAPVLNMIRSKLNQLAGYTTDKREVRVAQFVKIRQYAEQYMSSVNELKNYLEKLHTGKIEMVVTQKWDAYFTNARDNISQFIQNDYNKWMAKFQMQETQCAEVARDLVLVDTLKQILNLWPQHKMSDCVLGTDYRADIEKAYGTPYDATVTRDNAPIDKQIWDMVAAIETTFDDLKAAIDALK
jgi:hypothetical protein